MERHGSYPDRIPNQFAMMGVSPPTAHPLLTDIVTLPYGSVAGLGADVLAIQADVTDVELIGARSPRRRSGSASPTSSLPAGASPNSCSRPDVARDARAGHPHEPDRGLFGPCPFFAKEIFPISGSKRPVRKGSD